MTLYTAPAARQSFGRRLALESLRRTNPRSTVGCLWGFQKLAVLDRVSVTTLPWGNNRCLPRFGGENGPIWRSWLGKFAAVGRGDHAERVSANQSGHGVLIAATVGLRHGVGTGHAWSWRHPPGWCGRHWRAACWQPAWQDLQDHHATATAGTSRPRVWRFGGFSWRFRRSDCQQCPSAREIVSPPASREQAVMPYPVKTLEQEVQTG